MPDIQTRKDKIDRFLSRDVWKIQPVSAGRSLIFGFLRYFIMIFRGFSDDHCFLRATALSYTTVFSIVPVMAVLFAFLGAFAPFQKYETQIMDFVLGQLVPQRVTEQREGEDVKESISDRITQFITEKQGVLREQSAGIGAVGVGFLVFSVITVMATVEKSFNAIWGVRKGRPFLMRMIYYWFLTFVPILVVVSLGVAGSLMSSGAVQWLRGLPVLKGVIESRPVSFLVGLGTPLFFMWVGFTALYVFMPNTRVRVGAAMKGALWAAVLFELAKWGSFLLSGKAFKFSVLYGALAAIPFLLFWVYLIWLIVLLGAEVSFASQNIKTYSRERRVADASQATRESIAVRAFALIAERFYHGRPPLTATELSDSFDIPIRLVTELCNRMVEAGLLTEARDDYIRYQPGRDLERTSVKDVIDCLRRGTDHELRGQIRPEDRVAIDVFDRGESAADEVFASASFKQIVEQLAGVDEDTQMG